MKFRGWDLIIPASSLKILTKEYTDLYLTVRDMNADPDLTRSFISREKKMLCKTNNDSAFFSNSGSLILKFLPAGPSNSFHFSISLRKLSTATDQDTWELKHSPTIFSYLDGSILSENKITPELERQILEVRRKWEPLGSLPLTHLIRWGSTVRNDYVGRYSPSPSILSFPISSDTLQFDLAVLDAHKINPQTKFNGVMYHEYGHWAYARVFGALRKLELESIHGYYGGPSSPNDYRSFSEGTYELHGGGHPQDNTTELVASMCAILRYAPDRYIDAVQQTHGKHRENHRTLSNLIFEGIEEASSKERLAILFPEHERILSAI
jgi:hypothetical protein